MKKILLSLLLVGGFWAYSSAQTPANVAQSSTPALAMQSAEVADMQTEKDSTNKSKTEAKTTKSCCTKEGAKDKCGGQKTSTPSCCQPKSAARKD